jgi:CRP-like cAMP-binding protein
MHSKMIQMINRKARVFAYLILISHWMACGMKIVDEGWLTNYQDVRGILGREYLAAVYWSLTTLTTVGYGDITPSSDAERVFSIFSMAIGGAFYGYVVGAITTVVASSDLNQSAYHERMDLIYAWMGHHNLPKATQRTVRQYFKAFLSEKSAISEAEVFQDLSFELQREVGEYLIHEHVKLNPMFDYVGMRSVVRLMSILRRITIQPGNCIATSGEMGLSMYFIVSGQVEVDASADGSISKFRKLGEGGCFGEEIVLGFRRCYEYNVNTIEKCRMDMVFQDEFSNIFSTMPNVLDQMKKNVIKLHPNWATPNGELPLSLMKSDTKMVGTKTSAREQPHALNSPGTATQRLLKDGSVHGGTLGG